MRKFSLFLLFLPALTLYTHAQEPTLFLVGDSTVSSFNDATYYYPRYGFGTKIGDYLDLKKIKVVNLALSGRSSKSFLNRIKLQKAL